MTAATDSNSIRETQSDDASSQVSMSPCAVAQSPTRSAAVAPFEARSVTQTLAPTFAPRSIPTWATSRAVRGSAVASRKLRLL